MAISRDVQTGATARVREASGPRPAAFVPGGAKRYVNSESKFHALVIAPKVGDEKDEALCAAALEATGGTSIQFSDWVYMTTDPRLIAYLDDRIKRGIVTHIAEDASAEVAAVLAAAGLEVTGAVRATRKKSAE